jgi:acetyl-CoA acetyltransferase
MKAVMLAAQNISMGVRDVVLAGGMESMSNAPYIIRKLRGGASACEAGRSRRWWQSLSPNSHTPTLAS